MHKLTEFFTHLKFIWILFQASAKSASTTEDLNQPIDMDTGRDEDHDLGGANKVADWVKAAQRGFAH